MILEKLFNHFQYACYKRLSGIGLFDTSKTETITFFYTEKETLFTDGEVLFNDKDLGMMHVKKPSYCISGHYYDSSKYPDSTKVQFEVFLSNEDEDVVEKASKKLRELSKNVYFRSKKIKEVV